jgi:hypothetical protein
MLNPVTLTVAWEIVTLPVPVLFRVTDRVLLLPSVMFPKAILVGVALSERLTEACESNTTSTQ